MRVCIFSEISGVRLLPMKKGREGEGFGWAFQCGPHLWQTFNLIDSLQQANIDADGSSHISICSIEPTSSSIITFALMKSSSFMRMFLSTSTLDGLWLWFSLLRVSRQEILSTPSRKASFTWSIRVNFPARIRKIQPNKTKSRQRGAASNDLTNEELLEKYTRPYVLETK